MAACMASFRRSTTGAGVPVLATAPNQTWASRPARPSSSSVGTWGICGARSVAAIARGRSFLPAISGAVLITGSNIMSTWPAIRSCKPGAEPL
ncbi:hypothetical protein D3C71_1704980 [compost metagenome]